MVKLKMFGSLRLKSGFKEGEADVTSIKEACKYIAEVTGYPEKEIHNCNFLVNGKLVKPNSKLKDGDELTLMAASGGG